MQTGISSPTPKLTSNDFKYNQFFKLLITEIRDRNFDAIRFAAYRTASKLRFVQHRTLIGFLNFDLLIQAFKNSALNQLDINAVSDVTGLDRILGNIFSIIMNEIRQYRVEKSRTFNWIDKIDTLYITNAKDMLLGWLLYILDDNKSLNPNTRISLFAFRIILSSITSARPIEKFKYHFSLISNGAGQIIPERFELYVKSLISLAIGVFEGPSFNYIPGETSKFLLHSNRLKPILFDEFLEKMLSEPGSPALVWLTIFHRLALVENGQEFHQILNNEAVNFAKSSPILSALMCSLNFLYYHFTSVTRFSTVTHHVKCQACQREPLIGLRYKCTKCVRYNLCQDCFWMGAVTDFHTNAHDVKEYTAPSKSHTRQFGHTLRKLVRQGSNITNSPYNEVNTSGQSFSSPAYSGFEFNGPKSDPNQHSISNTPFLTPKNSQLSINTNPMPFLAPNQSIYAPNWNSNQQHFQRLFVNTNLPINMRVPQPLSAMPSTSFRIHQQNPSFFNPGIPTSIGYTNAGSQIAGFTNNIPSNMLAGLVSPIMRFSMPQATAVTDNISMPVSPDSSQHIGNTDLDLQAASSNRAILSQPTGKASPRTVVKFPQSAQFENPSSRLQTSHRSATDNSIDSSEHQLIAAYANRINSYHTTDHNLELPDLESKISQMQNSFGLNVTDTLDKKEASQKELISHLENKNKEILREIQRLRQEQLQHVMQAAALNSPDMHKTKPLRSISAMGVHWPNSVSQQASNLISNDTNFSRLNNNTSSTNTNHSRQEIDVELRALKARKDELDNRMNSLQEGRKELMIQLESLLKFANISPRNNDVCVTNEPLQAQKQKINFSANRETSLLDSSSSPNNAVSGSGPSSVVKHSYPHPHISSKSAVTFDNVATSRVGFHTDNEDVYDHQDQNQFIFKPPYTQCPTSPLKSSLRSRNEPIDNQTASPAKSGLRQNLTVFSGMPVSLSVGGSKTPHFGTRFTHLLSNNPNNMISTKTIGVNSQSVLTSIAPGYSKRFQGSFGGSGFSSDAESDFGFSGFPTGSSGQLYSDPEFGSNTLRRNQQNKALKSQLRNSTTSRINPTMTQSSYAGFEITNPTMSTMSNQDKTKISSTFGQNGHEMKSTDK